MDRSTAYALCKREREVLRCLIKGMSDKEMAKALSISEKTVQNHLQNIFKKLNCENRAKAAVKAIKLDLVL